MMPPGLQVIDTNEKNNDRAQNHEDADRTEKHLKLSLLHFTEYGDKQMDPAIKQYQGNENECTCGHATLYHDCGSTHSPTPPVSVERWRAMGESW